MEFEDILKDVGGFGLYQKILVIAFMIPTYTVLPWFSLGLIFMTDTPDHWCHVPDIAGSNLSLEVQKRLVRPPFDPSCSVYDINYSLILNSGNLTVDPDWPIRSCSNGWQYDTKHYDATAVTRWNIVCQDAHYSSLVLSMIFAGTVFGTPFYGFMSDKLGRKTTFFSLVAVMGIGEIGSVLSPYFSLFLVLRAIQGSVISTVYSTGYVILLELVSPAIRSRMNALATTAWTMGLCLLPLIAWLARNWVHLSVAIGSCAAGILLFWKLLPESPRWLISEERYEEAHAIMVKISKMNGKKAHIGNNLMLKIRKLGEKIKEQKDNEEKHSPIDFFKYPTLRKRFLLVATCCAGISITYYGLQVNVKNLTGNEFLNFFLVSVVEVPSHFATWIFLERIGRRWCSVLGFLISTLACLIPVFFLEAHPMIGVIASLMAKAGMSSAFMTLYQQSPEIFPTSLRCLGMAMTSSIASASTLLMPYMVYLAEFGAAIPFLIFSITSLIAGVCASFLPETLNKNLPQTVTDAENFEKDFKFCPCSGNIEEMETDSVVKPISWSPAVLSVADLQAPPKNSIVKDKNKDVPVIIQWN